MTDAAQDNQSSVKPLILVADDDACALKALQTTFEPEGLDPPELDPV